jgi:ATPase family AAA domain-containing protein 3A/B
MDYAILSGGDVAPLAEEAVTQLHALFRWAKKSSKGLLVFIDEAEAFLSSRNHIFGETGASDTHIRNALNALLYQTGTPSTNFMMILATNRPEDLDSAILDRIDVSIQISLPKYQQRIDLIQLYSNIHLASIIQKKQKYEKAFFVFKIFYYFYYWKLFLYDIEKSCFDEKTMEFIAKYLDGFSGREISKLYISLQYGLFLSEKYCLSWKIMKEIIKNKIQEHFIKMNGFQSFNNDSFQFEHFEDEDPVKEAHQQSVKGKSGQFEDDHDEKGNKKKKGMEISSEEMSGNEEEAKMKSGQKAKRSSAVPTPQKKQSFSKK